MRCGVYVRVSRADAEDTSSTDRQERACRELIRLREWSHVETFVDHDRSAFKPVERPALDALLDAVLDEAIDAVVIWRLDRLTRRAQDFERIWSICEANGVALVSVTEPLDTSTPVGIAIGRMLVTFAGLESTVKSQRLAARNEQDARAGRVPTPGRAAFGYTCDYEIVPAEAALIREAADRIVAGASASTIANDWNDRNIASPTGKRWSSSVIRTLMMARRHEGIRTYHGDVVAEDCWPAILDRRTAAEVRYALMARAGGRRPAVESLLTGRLRCGICDRVLVHHRHRETRRYRCQSRDGCGRVSTKADPLEEWLTPHVLDRVDRHLARNARRPRDQQRDDAIAEVLDNASSTLRELNRDYFITHRLSRAEWRDLRRECLGQVDVSASVPGPDPVPPGLPPGMTLREAADRFEKLSVVSQRAVVAVVVDRVVVANRGRGRRTFEPSQFTVHWSNGETWQPAGPLNETVDDSLPATSATELPTELDPTGPWWSPRQVANRIDVPRGYVNDQIRAGNLRAFRHGTQALIHGRDLDDWTAAKLH